MRSSYSQNNTYTNCPTHWDWSYNKKLKGPDTSSSLYFGSAVDESVMAMLKNETGYLDVFYSRWKSAKAYGNGPDIPIFDNPNITYSAADLDCELFSQSDYDDIGAWAKQLKVSKTGIVTAEDIIQIGKNIRNPHKKVSDSAKKFFNRACWLSLNIKGEIMVESFKKDFFPLIKKVHAVQIPGKIVTAAGDTMFGYLDFVAEIEGYADPIIFDLKTASKPYGQKQIDTTEQLTLYYAMAGEQYKTNYVGYVVLSKAINKNETGTCKTCGANKTSSHRTCNAAVNGVRCKGDWDIKKELDPKVQVLIESKSVDQKTQLISDYSNVMQAMKSGVIFKNLDKCNNWYGQQCPYFNACHKNDTTGLITK